MQRLAKTGNKGENSGTGNSDLYLWIIGDEEQKAYLEMKGAIHGSSTSSVRKVKTKTKIEAKTWE